MKEIKRNVKVGKKQRQCPILNCAYFNYESKVKLHFKVKHEKNLDCVCPTCGFATGYKANLKEHIRRVHENKSTWKKYHKTKEIKPDVKIGVEEVKAYVEIAKRQKQCPISGCTRLFVKKESTTQYVNHFRYVHGKKDVQCSNCKFVTVSTHHLRKHVKRIHDKTLSLQCSKCKYFAENESELKLHFKGKHDKIRDYTCHVCGYATSYNSCLKKHLLNAHETEKAELFLLWCPIISCGRRLESMKHLKAHLYKIHSLD